MAGKPADGVGETVRLAVWQPLDTGAVRSIILAVGWGDLLADLAEQEARRIFDAGGGDAAGMLALLIKARTPGDASDAPFGYILVQHHAWNNLAQIQTLAVHPAWQRHGAGRRLVDAGEAWARARGTRGVYVDTPTTNHKGVPFYLASGYRAAYVMPRYYGDDLDGITFQKFWEQA